MVVATAATQLIGQMWAQAVTCKVTLVSEEHGINSSIECAEDVFILDVAQEAGIDLPDSCRAGASSICAGQITSGTVDQSDPTFLVDDQIEAGHVLTCIACPISDCTIQTHAEDDLHGWGQAEMGAWWGLSRRSPPGSAS